MKKNLSDILIGLSVLAAIISGYVNLSQSDFFKLAGTQWILVAVILGIYGLYAKMRTA